MEFPRIPCGLISLDVEDASGIPQTGVTNDVTRMRLDSRGRPRGESEAIELSVTCIAFVFSISTVFEPSRDLGRWRADEIGMDNQIMKLLAVIA